MPTPTPTSQVRFGMGYLMIVLGTISLAFAIVAPTSLNTPNAYITICVAAMVLAAAWLGDHAVIGLVSWAGSLSAAAAVGLLLGALTGSLVARLVGILAPHTASVIIVGAMLGLVLALSLWAACWRRLPSMQDDLQHSLHRGPESHLHDP